MLRISYRNSDRKAILSWDTQDDDAPWIDVIRRLVFDKSEDARQEHGCRISLPWWSFTSLRGNLLEVFKGYGLELGSSLFIEDKAKEFLQRSNSNIASYSLATTTPIPLESTILSKLDTVRFTRRLTKEQRRNIARLAALPASATFSVPGAGKTTEALALFFFRSQVDERLLVIAPKNAFAAWDEQLNECVPTIQQRFVRLRGGQERIARLLEDDPRFMLITYQQLPRVRDLIAFHVSQNRTHIFLDESHRIKSGTSRLTPQAVLSLSHLPVGKLIMSGTPMPQSLDDLIPQFAFLYPEIPATTGNVVSLIRPVYVRTNKRELGLPPVNRVVRRMQMAPVQRELYRLMKHEVAREAATALSIKSKQAFRALGRSVARLLQFVSNPALLSSEIGFAHPDLLRAVLAEGDGPKMKYVLSRTQSLAMEGKKILIWSSFVRNVEYIADRLADLGAVFIHGGVDAGDEDDDETREGKIKLFHDNPNVRVMVANPAAASEGISLHTVCHHAIYLDRTFNAAHYLQSEDRIHRLGLPPDQITNIELVECIGTVDETVRDRLNLKVSAMAEALEDSSLRIDPIPLDPISIDDPDEYVVGIAEEDMQALLRDLGNNES